MTCASSNFILRNVKKLKPKQMLGLCELCDMKQVSSLSAVPAIAEEETIKCPFKAKSLLNVYP